MLSRTIPSLRSLRQCTGRAAAAAHGVRAQAVPALSLARFSTGAGGGEPTLKDALEEVIPKLRARVTNLRKHHGDAVIGQVTVGSIIGGMRGIKGLFTETSHLDAEEGIRFRDLTIPDCREQLPRATGGEEPLPEGLLWLLLTGKVPTKRQVDGLIRDLHARSELPQHVIDLVNSYPRHMHAMTQLCSAVLAMQTESKFATDYRDGKVGKMDMWEPTLEDSLNLIARLPQVAAMIYTNKFRDGKHVAPDLALDWSANYAHMMGFHSPDVFELMRLYLTIHSDHEGGNVSAHATHLVGSALSDPYLSFAAGMAGLAGPLHGLANANSLQWLTGVRDKYGNANGEMSKETLAQACWDTLNSGQVIPGFGHAVLRKTDPRYTCQREFALKHMPDDPLFKICRDLYEVAPQVLTEHGKTKNPWPNVDAHSGVLLQHYGLVEADYYTVLFGVSRSLGVLASLTLDRALGLPIERPKSLTLDVMEKEAAEVESKSA